MRGWLSSRTVYMCKSWEDKWSSTSHSSYNIVSNKTQLIYSESSQLVHITCELIISEPCYVWMWQVAEKSCKILKEIRGLRETREDIYDEYLRNRYRLSVPVFIGLAACFLRYMFEEIFISFPGWHDAESIGWVCCFAGYVIQKGPFELPCFCDS